MKSCFSPRGKGSRGRQAGGFTLIEVLLVLVILVILGAIAVPMFAGIGDAAKKQAAQVQVNAVEDAIKFFNATTSQYPTSLEDLTTAPSDAKLARRWAGPYLEGKSLVDPWENPYQYDAKGKKSPNGYDIWSMGPDGQSGTDDDIGNWEVE